MSTTTLTPQATTDPTPATPAPVTSTPVLAQLRGAGRTYGSGEGAVHAVRDLDLSVRAGELLAVLGPNGAGKSTAVGMLTGLVRPTSGTARLFGRDPRDLAARRRVGAMLQTSGVPETLRVRELLTQFRGYYPAPMAVPDVVQAAGLDGLERRLFGELSGGQQRRVLFGLALCGDPELLFFDEPTTGLDVDVRRTLWATLRDLTRAGRGVVLTTHYLEEADALADRVVVLDHGRVLAEGTPEHIKSLVPGRRVRARTCAAVADVGTWPGVLHVERQGPWLEVLVAESEAVVRRLLAGDADLAGLTVTEPTLEEAFLALTTSTR
ncbi:ABC transporter ATP-binding protein [Aquipuribacter nitratireducens]|uniref:ATP-binding cassette domain-containing protein n=1 Tax=Aquipuribacter nitratireducens TaxID=650104 RepID=A0ABW0GRN1_9MICO